MPAAIDVLEVIAEPTRRRILDAVRGGERSVGELVEQVGMHQPGVSRHLKVLRDAGLVEVRRDAQRRMYRLRPEPLMELDAWLEPYRAEWAGRLDALERHLHRTATPVSAEGKGTPMSDRTTSSVRRHVGAHRRRRGHPVRTSSRLPVRDVWDAITDPARLADWWLPFDADITVDLREGGEMVFAATGDEPMTITCTILRVEPPMLLEHTHVDPGSSMRWELEAVDTGCVLRLSHFVTDPGGAVESVLRGRAAHLARHASAVPRRRPGRVGLGRFAATQAHYAAVGLASPSSDAVTTTAEPPSRRERQMSQLLRVQCFGVSSDGFGAGEGQSLERPFGHADPARPDRPGPAPPRAGPTAPSPAAPGARRLLHPRHAARNIGAEIMGRNKFGPQRGPWEDHEWQGWWGDDPPFHTPVFVLTHHERPSFTLADTTFHFVDATPAEALEQAARRRPTAWTCGSAAAWRPSASSSTPT